MFYKVILFCFVISIVTSIEIKHAPVYYSPKLLSVVKQVTPITFNQLDPEYNYDINTKYNFKYGVEDRHSGDVKSQQEEREGDVVKGEYSILQPDGVTRIVKYSADKHNGFTAHITYTGHSIHPQKIQKTQAVFHKY